MKKIPLTSSSRAAVQVLIAALLFGASAPLSKLLLGEIAPVSLAAFLYLGSGVVSWLIILLQRKSRVHNSIENTLERSDFPWLAGAILAGGIAAPILSMIGLSSTPASTASLLLNFESVATGIIAIFLFKESVGKKALWAMGLITAAAILLSWTGGNWGVSIGVFAILGACFLWGLDNNFTRHISAKNPLLIVGFKGLFSGSFSLVLSLLLGNPLPSLKFALLAMALGAFSYGLSIQLFILALRSLGAARTSTLFGTSPFIGVLLSFLIFAERPLPLFWIALPCMLIGTWLMVNENHSHHHIHNAVIHTHPHSHPDPHHLHEHGGEEGLFVGVHSHLHTHELLEHEHTHTPDLHHWHSHP